FLISPAPRSMLFPYTTLFRSPPGVEVRGVIDAERRRDHMQQHTGQHLLSAAFIRLLNAKTVSFYLGEQVSTIDLDIQSISHDDLDRKSTRLNSSHSQISYAVF